MRARSEAATKGDYRRREDKVVATHFHSTIVTFRLYDKLGNGSTEGSYIAGPHPRGGRAAQPKQEQQPFWIYLFQDSWGPIELTHQVYVDEQGRYSYAKQQDLPAERKSTDTTRSVVLTTSDAYDNQRRAYEYHVLLSPFPIPQPRLDLVIPNGRIEKGQTDKRKKFLEWSKERSLTRIVFKANQEKSTSSVLVELWAPWLMAEALTDDYNAAMALYGKAFLDNGDVVQVATLVKSLEHAIKLDDYVSTTNLDDFIKSLPKMTEAGMTEACVKASDRLVEYLDAPPFQEMLFDMWTDKSGDAHVALLPCLAYCYRAVPADKFGEKLDRRLLNYTFNQYDWKAGTKHVRRAIKALIEVNATFANALKMARKHGAKASSAAKATLHLYVDGARWWVKKLLGVEILWNSELDRWDDLSIETIKKAAGKAPFLTWIGHTFEGLNAGLALWALHRDRKSARAWVGLVGACSSFLSSSIRVMERYTADPAYVRRIDKQIAEAFAGSPTLPLESERRMLQQWAGRKQALKIAAAVRSKAIVTASRGFGFVSGAMDAIGAYMDFSKALDQGDETAAQFHLMTAVGGALLLLGIFAGPAFPAVLLWAGALGQVLELFGSIGGALAQGSDLEIWLRFCKFGKRNALKDASSRPDWTGGYSLGEIAQSPSRQLRAFYRIVYQMEIEAEVIEFDRIEAQLSVVAKFPYGYPKESQLYMRIEVARVDGSSGVFRPFAPWPKARPPLRYRGTQTQEGHMYDAGSVLIGAKSITISICLDTNGQFEMYPDQLITKTFLVDDLPHHKA